MALAGTILTIACRASYYISLLGLKIPLGLLVNASRARHVLAFIVCVWVPLLVYCHLSLIPWIQESGNEVVWQCLTLLWITLPLLTVGAVILSKVRALGPCMAFLAALTVVAAFHKLAIPFVAHHTIGTWLLHGLFAFFEDMPIVGWLWCLWHVVRLQDHVARQQTGKRSPFGPCDREIESEEKEVQNEGEASIGGPREVLIVGNAPTVTEGPPLGSFIDNFEHVVRFNSYSVSKPPFTGSRVGYHFCNGRNFPTIKTVKAILPLFNASLTHAVYLFMPHLEDSVQIYANLTSTKVDTWFAEEARILALRKVLGCRPWQIPTSGAVAIDSFLAERGSVTLHGFNFFQSKKIHYFEESATQLITSWLERFVTHDPSLEKVWVANLVKEGKASFLADRVRKQTGGDKEEESEHVKEVEDDPKADSDKLKDEDKTDEGGDLRRRTPNLMQTLLKDGFPSQFSL